MIHSEIRVLTLKGVPNAENLGRAEERNDAYKDKAILHLSVTEMKKRGYLFPRKGKNGEIVFIRDGKPVPESGLEELGYIIPRGNNNGQKSVSVKLPVRVTVETLDGTAPNVETEKTGNSDLLVRFKAIFDVMLTSGKLNDDSVEYIISLGEKIDGFIPALNALEADSRFNEKTDRIKEVLT